MNKLSRIFKISTVKISFLFFYPPPSIFLEKKKGKSCSLSRLNAFCFFFVTENSVRRFFLSCRFLDFSRRCFVSSLQILIKGLTFWGLLNFFKGSSKFLRNQGFELVAESVKG